MIVVQSLADLRSARSELPSDLGLVPTMGYLHEGHLSLVRAARDKCAACAASIFVNPSQFGPGEDLENYPRDLERDLRLLEQEGVDLVWTPGENDLYPSDFQTWVEVQEISQPLEGAHRPGHFRGVTTVVAMLFHAFEPRVAFFGQKDAQQVIVIRRMVDDLLFPVQIAVRPTVREPDGLAMSSRNSYLNPAERKAAPVLYRTLNQAARAYRGGEKSARALREIMAGELAMEPLAEPEYVSVASLETLHELEGDIESGLLSMAVRIGVTRLIDNVIVGANDSFWPQTEEADHAADG